MAGRFMGMRHPYNIWLREHSQVGIHLTLSNEQLMLVDICLHAFWQPLKGFKEE